VRKKLKRSFYTREDVLVISRELLGKVLVTNFKEGLTSGMIVETEAYQGVEDKAAHSYGGRRTKRTEIMYRQGGTAYVYFIYGIHHMFNVVTNAIDTPHAVLVRALEPIDGIDIMLHRRNKLKLDYTLTKGPGALAQALGIHKNQTGLSLLGNEIWIEDRGIKIPKSKIISSPRIGVDYAGEHAKWNYRFYVKDNPWVSGIRNKK
jgi:DNA-3-methyladenine glycosylase